MKNDKSVFFRCDDKAGSVVFTKLNWKWDDNDDDDISYEITIEDSYCGGDYMGIKGRFKRAWMAFFARPICYTGVFTDDAERLKKFLKDCLELMEE